MAGGGSINAIKLNFDMFSPEIVPKLVEITGGNK